MPSTLLAFSAAALLGFAQFTHAQTNITSHACASGSEYNSCNRKVAEDWSSCIRDCNGNGDCIVDCGCTSHQNYINCMAQTCWNQVHKHKSPVPILPLQAINTTRNKSLTMKRSTPANINSSSNNTSQSAQVQENRFPSGHPQITRRTAAPVI